MQKYCFLLDAESGLVQLGAGCSEEYYISIGMKLRDVEQSEKDNQWYLKDKCPHYTEEEKIAMREADFKSKFFLIEGFGWYRKQPKGYQSAVESMNVLFNIANVSDGIQAGLIIFYQEPDFTKEEECTEEWLIGHQIIQPAMTKQAFMSLYVSFMTAWNTEEHEGV